MQYVILTVVVPKHVTEGMNSALARVADQGKRTMHSNGDTTTVAQGALLAPPLGPTVQRILGTRLCQICGCQQHLTAEAALGYLKTPPLLPMARSACRVQTQPTKSTWNPALAPLIGQYTSPVLYGRDLPSLCCLFQNYLLSLSE